MAERRANLPARLTRSHSGMIASDRCSGEGVAGPARGCRSRSPSLSTGMAGVVSSRIRRKRKSVRNLVLNPMRRRPLLLAGALLIVVALAVAACAVPSVQPQDGAPVAADADNQDAANVAEDAAEASAEVEEDAGPNPALQFMVDGEPTEEYNGIPAGLTTSGLPYLGDPDAPVLLIEYSDYECPFCGRHFVQTAPALTESFIRSGDVRTVFVEFPLEGLHPTAPAAHAAALCVLEQGSVENYWNMHGELFRSVEEWGGAPDARDVFVRLAEESGADPEALEACLEEGEQLAQVNDLVSFAMAQGFQGTPSFQLIRVEDGAVSQFSGAQPFDEFERRIDSLLAGEMPAEPEQQAEAEPEIPVWATAEGWQPDPDRPGYNMAGDQYKGNVDAPITVIEFSDFQCPYCRRHAQETQPTLDEQYVDTGDVHWVFKHFPLDIHPQAPMAGVAAECAAEQGKFWEMAELIFDSQPEWSTPDPVPVLSGLAEELELDMDAFAACLDDPEKMDRVDSDMAEGRQFVQGTPTFIILKDGDGSIVPGALPVDSFVQLFDELLATGTE
jgi:protein-disulfide isomerase